MTETRTRPNHRTATMRRSIDESRQPLRVKLLTAKHATAFLAVVADELMGDPTRIPATIKRKQLFADMVLLFHLHVAKRGNSTVDIARVAHVDLLVVKKMLTPLVELGLLRWEYRGNHANGNGSGRVRHYFFSDRIIARTIEAAGVGDE